MGFFCKIILKIAVFSLTTISYFICSNSYDECCMYFAVMISASGNSLGFNSSKFLFIILSVLTQDDIIAQFSKSLSITALISKPAFSNAYILPPNPAFKSKTLFPCFCYLPYIFYNSISKQLKLRT